GVGRGSPCHLRECERGGSRGEVTRTGHPRAGRPSGGVRCLRRSGAAGGSPRVPDPGPGEPVPPHPARTWLECLWSCFPLLWWLVRDRATVEGSSGSAVSYCSIQYCSGLVGPGSL